MSETEEKADRVKNSKRQQWMAVLARASQAELEAHLTELGSAPIFQHLRKPETGLVMMRGRAGGTGQPFNLGEVTVSRCSVSVDTGEIGHGYVMGRNLRHAELVAIFDAYLQKPDLQDNILDAVVTPLSVLQKQKREEKSRKAAATKVDFFTMVRGED